MKYRSAVVKYFAINGYLFELNPWLWEQLPYHDEARFQTVRLRPKVSIAGKDEKAGTVTLVIRPLPGFMYKLVVP
jgi:hypothetical protein